MSAGLFKTVIYVYGMGIGINLGKILRYLTNNSHLPEFFKKINGFINNFNQKISRIFQIMNNTWFIYYFLGFWENASKKSF